MIYKKKINIGLLVSSLEFLLLKSLGILFAFKHFVPEFWDQTYTCICLKVNPTEYEMLFYLCLKIQVWKNYINTL